MYKTINLLMFCGLWCAVSGCNELPESDDLLFQKIANSGELSSSEYQNPLLGIKLQFPAGCIVTFDSRSDDADKEVQAFGIDGVLFAITSDSGDVVIHGSIPSTSLGSSRSVNELYPPVLDSAVNKVYRSYGYTVKNVLPVREMCNDIVVMDYRLEPIVDSVSRRLRLYLLGYDKLLLIVSLESSERSFVEASVVFEASICEDLAVD